MEENKNYEEVQHPSHYNREGGIECLEEMEEVFGTNFVKIFCLGNAWKYRYGRIGKPHGDLEKDLHKSDFYMQKYIEYKKKEDAIKNYSYATISTNSTNSTNNYKLD